LEGRRNLTYLLDGWEDRSRRSIYGSVIAEVGEHPVVLGLKDLTGHRATADKLVEVSDEVLKRKSVSPACILAVCTDNPTTMQAFRRKWTADGHNKWIIVSQTHLAEDSNDTDVLYQPLFCFMHGMNTIIGKIVLWPSMKQTVRKNACIVSFFESSHYWGGQLQDLARKQGLQRGLKTNTESRFYSLILQGLSIQEHKLSLTQLCLQDDAQRSVRGLTPVAKDVVAAVLDFQQWALINQLIRICKPLVDVIGNIKSRDTTLADCMLELIWAHWEVN
jgi:hypothetical protein